jgi:hypothetical protein
MGHKKNNWRHSHRNGAIFRVETLRNLASERSRGVDGLHFVVEAFSYAVVAGEAPHGHDLVRPGRESLAKLDQLAEAGLAQLVDGVQEARHEMLPCDGCWIVGNPEAISNGVRGECAARSAFGLYSLVYL